MDLALPLLLVRLIIGLGFAAHGAQKLFGWFGGYGLAGTGGFLETLGFRPGKAFAAAAGFAELAGGLLLAFGLLGPVGPALVISAMVVAIATVHLRNGFFAASNGVELPLLYLVIAVSYAFAGYGGLSLDAAFGIAGLCNGRRVGDAADLQVSARRELHRGGAVCGRRTRQFVELIGGDHPAG